MKEKEKLFLSNLLEMASDEFSNHGCNDLPKELQNLFTDQEKEILAKEFCKFNKEDPKLALEDWGSWPNYFNALGDWAWMWFFAKKIMEK